MIGLLFLIISVIDAFLIESGQLNSCPIIRNLVLGTGLASGLIALCHFIFLLATLCI